MWTHVSILLFPVLARAILYPYDTPSRETKSLDGFWNFKPDPPGMGFNESWFLQPLTGADDMMQMPVPSSYNDIGTSSSLRDLLGYVWYERQFKVPDWSQDRRIMIRFGSVHYKAWVWVNGLDVGGHEGGHMAFEMDITAAVNFNLTQQRVTVAVDNRLSMVTVPQGNVVDHGLYMDMETEFDFFNYAGLHRPVVLYTTPKHNYTTDIEVKPIFPSSSLDTVTLYWTVSYEGSGDCNVEILFEDELVIDALCSQGSSGLVISDPILWWPRGHGHPVGQMYDMRVRLGEDVYTLPFGVRKLDWDEEGIRINNEPVYLHGIARHEDSVTRGKGLDLPTLARDHQLLSWLGANSYRTSHYPYAEEDLLMSDREGLLVIAECAAVSLDGFSSGLLENHLLAVEELYMRDRNHPSVVMWSVANEPRSFRPEAEPYFELVTSRLRTLDDNSRPVTAIMYDHGDNVTDGAAPHLDIIGVNKYIGWYTDTGHLEVITTQLEASLRQWHETYGKPVMVTEYGGDTVAGLHSLPGLMFTEEWQVEMLRQYWEVFDILRSSETWFIGEMPWVFSDFMTKQEIRRVAGNKKGLFTRDRQPKMAAHLLRDRYRNTMSHRRRRDEL